MAVNEDVTSYSTVAASNTPAGTDVIGSDLDDHLRDMKKNMATLLDLVQAATAVHSGVEGLSATPGASSTIAFRSGGCVDISGDVAMRYTHAGLTSRILTAGAYVGGSGGNIMETAGGRVANTGYYIWAIHDSTNNTSDFLATTSSSFSGITFPGTYDKAQLLWFLSLNASGFIRRWNALRNSNVCTYFEPVTATAGAGAGTFREFQDLSLLNIAPVHSLVKLSYNLFNNPSQRRVAVWLADGSSSHTATFSNATMAVVGDAVDGSLQSQIGTTQWVGTDATPAIRYAYTEPSGGSAGVNIQVMSWQLLRRGNAAG